MAERLRRELGLTQLTLTVIGLVIGSGIFALPAVVLGQAGAPGLALASWVVGGLVSLAAGLTVAELTAAMPRAGGTYVILGEAYGEWMGFLQGWSFFLAYNSALAAALAMLFATYLSALIPLGAGVQTLIGLGLILMLTAVNAIGVRFGGMIQVVATLGKLIPIFLLILFGLMQIDPANLRPLLPVHGGVGTALAGAVLPVLFAFDGWINAGMMAEEVKNPQRNLPLALVGGLAVVTVIYLLFNLALLGMVPHATLMASEKPVMPMAQALFGGVGAQFITVGMLISMFGTLNAVLMTAPRYYFAMARDGLFPAARYVSRLHPRLGTPVAALLINAAWSAVLLLSGKFEQMLSLVVFVGWLFNILSMVAVILLRRTRPELPRPYRVWGYPWVPVVGIAAGLWIVGTLFATDAATALLGLGVTLTGLPIYWLLRWRKAQGSGSHGAL